MQLRKHLEQEPVKRRKSAAPKNRFSALAAHKAFVPIVTIWGAALFGLSMAVLPYSMIGRIGAASGGLIPGNLVGIVLPALAAMIGGALALIVSTGLRSAARSDRPGATDIYSAYNASRTRPIDPASELGSESLDAPIAEGLYEDADDAEVADADIADADTGESAPASREPTLGELAKRGYEIEDPDEDKRDTDLAFTHTQYKDALIECCEGATCEAADTETDTDANADTAEATKSPLVAKPRRSDSESKPRALDLGEFAELKGRNAVWVEEPVDQPAQVQPATVTAAVDEPAGSEPATALEKLRRKSTEELSLVEMVERFAGALHEHQQSERGRTAQGGPGRDVALAEALKALTLFTEGGFDTGSRDAQIGQLSQTERDLRDALAKLQTLRGAA